MVEMKLEIYFKSAERIARFQREAASWLGTPFRDGIGPRAKRGTACDCVSYVAAVLQACGAIGPVPWPKCYVSMTGGPEMLDILIGTLSGVPRLARIEDSGWKMDDGKIHFQSSILNPLRIAPGDILVGSTGRSRHHIALYVGDNRLLHCWSGEVREGNIKDPALIKHLHSVWRAYEPETQNSKLETVSQ
jgi:cell wall-associated NlpC family hydrolase